MHLLMRAVIMLGLSIALAACQEDEDLTSGDDFSATAVLAEAQRDCERDGGTWGNTGEELFVCFKPTSDANQFCRAASDCESLCLARSRTCAPTDPFFGCHEVLTDSGRRATECVN